MKVPVGTTAVEQVGKQSEAAHGVFCATILLETENTERFQE